MKTLKKLLAALFCIALLGGNWQENKKTRGTFTLMFSEL